MPGNRLTLLCCLEGSTPEDRVSHQAKDIVVAPAELFVLPRAAILFSGGLGGVPPWAFRHRSLLKTSLGSSPMP